VGPDERAVVDVAGSRKVLALQMPLSRNCLVATSAVKASDTVIELSSTLVHSELENCICHSQECLHLSTLEVGS
jgi:hypothetical protein